MKRNKGNRKGDEAVIIKPIWWRQGALTLFLFACGCSFALIDYKYVGLVVTWIIMILFTILSLLSLLDQIFEWSRLRIDKDGYDLRTWFKRKRFRHQEIDFFSSQTYLNRQLIILNLRKQALEKYNMINPAYPFPCTFGQPVEDVLKRLQESLDKTPRKQDKHL